MSVVTGMLIIAVVLALACVLAALLGKLNDLAADHPEPDQDEALGDMVDVARVMDRRDITRREP